MSIVMNFGTLGLAIGCANRITSTLHNHLYQLCSHYVDEK